MRKLLLAVLLLAPMSARASTFDTYGFGSRSLSMGGAMTADASDFSAAFYNPSLIALHNKINLGFGIFYEKPNVTVTPDTPQSSFVSIDPPDAASYTLGFIFPFAGKFQDRAGFGLGISLPTRNLIKVQAVEPNEPSWYLYQSSPDRIQVFLGLGARPVDWLALGLGIQALADFSGNIDFNIDIFNKNFQRRDLVNELTTKQGLVAGLTLIPLKNLRIGLSYRQSMELDYQLPTNIVLGDLGTLFLNVKGVTFYTPHEFTLGVHYEPLPNVKLSGDLEYARWSVAPNPAAQVTVRFNGDLAKGLGLDQALALDSQDAALGFEDIIIPRIGVEWDIADALSLRGGYYFRPTMVPEQNGLTNLLDGPTHALSFGIGVRFMSPLETMVDPVQIDAVFQHAFIGQRHADKSDNNPVVPYSYTAQTDVLAIDVRYNFDIVRPTPSSPPLESKDGDAAKSDSDEDKPQKLKKEDAAEETPKPVAAPAPAPAPKPKPKAKKPAPPPKPADDDSAT